MVARLCRWSRLSGIRAIHFATLLVIAPILLSTIIAFPDIGQSPKEDVAIFEKEDLKLNVVRLESILEKNIEVLNRKVLLIQEKDMVIEDMNRKIEHLQSFLCNMKKSRGGSAYSEERVNFLEEEVRNLWCAARKNNFDLHALHSKAYDAEEKLDFMSSQTHKMEDIITNQWIQIKNLEEAIQITELSISKAYKEIKSSSCTFLKFINLLQKNSFLRSYAFYAFSLLKRISLDVQRCHHQMQDYVLEIVEKNEFTEAFANEEVIFFLASVIIILPIMAAWLLYSSSFGSPEKE